jgi:hypothetical protein
MENIRRATRAGFSDIYREEGHILVYGRFAANKKNPEI